MIDSPQRSRLSTAILLISASAVLGTVALVFGAAVVVGLTVQLLVFALCLGVPILRPYLLALRICLALLRRFHGNLWGSLALHMTINSTASFALLRAAFA